MKYHKKIILFMYLKTDILENNKIWSSMYFNSGDACIVINWTNKQAKKV